MFSLSKTFSLLKNASKLTNNLTLQNGSISVRYYCSQRQRFSFSNKKGSEELNYGSNDRGFDSFRGNNNNNSFIEGARGGNNMGFEIQNINWDEQDLTPIKKNLLPPHKITSETPAATLDFLTANEIKVQTDAPLPHHITSFSEVPFDNNIIKLLGGSFPAPTPIQAIGWPIALSGRDVVGISKTGSGKTLGFILPAIQHILSQQRQEHYKGPKVLVVAPTRELSVQIERETLPYLEKFGIRSICCYGGSSKTNQVRFLRMNPGVVVGTPGRLLDLQRDGYLDLKNVSYLVLDEADRMLEMGFEDQVRSIFSAVRPDRQVQYWSATWPSKVQTLAKKFIKDPITVKVGSAELTANQDITQKFIFVHSDADKPKHLLETLENIYTERPTSKTLIFTMTKTGAEKLTEYINNNGNAKVVSLHGDKPQATRQHIIDDFKRNRFDILVATDVASRGLDIKDITDIINFSLPPQIESYVHRIGRTARAGQKGYSHSIVSKSNANDLSILSELRDLLERSKQEVPQEIVDILPNSSNNNNRGGYGGNRGGNRGGYGGNRGGYGGNRGGYGGDRGGYGGDRGDYNNGRERGQIKFSK